VDDALSSTSINTVQNNIITNALAEKLDKSGGTINGTLTISDGDILMSGKHLVGNGTELSYNNKTFYSPPYFSYDSITLINGVTGGLRILRMGNLRILTTSGYITPNSYDVVAGNLNASDVPRSMFDVRGALMYYGSSAIYGYFEVQNSTGNIHVYCNGNGLGAKYCGQVAWITA